MIDDEETHREELPDGRLVEIEYERAPPDSTHDVHYDFKVYGPDGDLRIRESNKEGSPRRYRDDDDDGRPITPLDSWLEHLEQFMDDISRL